MSSNPQWLQILFDATPENAELLSDLLSEAGALAVTLQDRGDEPILEPAPGDDRLWSETCVIGLFDADTDSSDILHHIRQALPEGSIGDCRVKRLADQDWERMWLQHFQPMRFGQRLWVCPTAYDAPDPDAVNIILDPGLAFGTGTHPTTALCLEWLDRHDVRGQDVIDYGCGSGILAIAAARLGARRVYAVDIDTQALLACEENAQRNGVAALVHPGNPAELPARPVDCLLANILANPLMELAETFSRLVRPGGSLVLSGLLTEQEAQVRSRYEAWFDLSTAAHRDNWLCLSGQRRA